MIFLPPEVRTPNHDRVLVLIATWFSFYRTYPSQRELGAFFGWAYSYVNKELQRLRAMGLLSPGGRPRCLPLTPDGWARVRKLVPRAMPTPIRSSGWGDAVPRGGFVEDDPANARGLLRLVPPAHPRARR